MNSRHYDKNPKNQQSKENLNSSRKERQLCTGKQILKKKNSSLPVRKNASQKTMQ